jgi:hypothetical protein
MHLTIETTLFVPHLVLYGTAQAYVLNKQCITAATHAIQANPTIRVNLRERINRSRRSSMVFLLLLMDRR